MSEEKVLTLRGKKAVWAPGGGSGPIDPKRLPEGYPYKEGSKTVIEWDGTTGAPVAIEDYYSAYKVSDAVADSLAGCTVLVEFMGETNEDTLGDGVEVTEGVIRYDLGNIPVVCVVFDGNTSGLESGIYFAKDEDHYGHSALVKKLSFGEVTIHPMAPEFLPAGVGGGVQVVEIVTEDWSKYTTSHTGNEIAAMMEKGTVIAKLIYQGAVNGIFGNPFYINGIVGFFAVQTPSTTTATTTAATLLMVLPSDKLCSVVNFNLNITQ